MFCDEPYTLNTVWAASGKKLLPGNATAVPIGMKRLNKVANYRVAGEYYSVILRRYSKSGINFKGTGRPCGVNKMNPD